MKKILEKFEQRALQLDAEDPLRNFRERFALPKGTLASHKIYFCSHSLGMPPIEAFNRMQIQIENWSEYGATAWFQGKEPWASFDHFLIDNLASLLGAQSKEVVIMNSLTVNLHLLLISFYKPLPKRYKILIDSPTFSSDLYAMKSHIRYHGFDPEQALVILKPRPGEILLRQEDIEAAIAQEGDALSLVLLSGVNFLTGQVLEIESIAHLAHQKGCLVGFDVAHAAGNIVLHLHAWDVDFAVGCSYKYLCAGPGGPGFAYIHEKHHKSHLPRFSGWWGNDPKTRFQMQQNPEFVPHGGASSWQVSTPAILAMTPMASSLHLYNEAGIERIRKKSEQQTAFLFEVLDVISSRNFEVITPKKPSQRGCQISLRINDSAEKYLSALEKLEVICDFRPPDVIRAAPSPLYNTFYEIYQFAQRFLKVIDLLHN